MKRLIIFGFLFGILLPSVAVGAGIQVTPEKLNFEVNKTQTKEVIVANPTADVQLFDIYPDDYDRSIKANPSSFTLEAGGRKKVLVTVNSRDLSGITTTNLSITSKPLVDSKVEVNTGVKLPVTIKITSGSFKDYLPYAIGLALLIVLSSSLIFWRKKNK